MGVGLDSASEGSNSSMNSSMNSSARLGRAGRVKFGFRFWDLQPSSNKSGGSRRKRKRGQKEGGPDLVLIIFSVVALCWVLIGGC